MPEAGVGVACGIDHHWHRRWGWRHRRVAVGEQPLGDERAELGARVAHHARVVLVTQVNVLLALDEERRQARRHGLVRVDHRGHLLEKIVARDEVRERVPEDAVLHEFVEVALGLVRLAVDEQPVAERLLLEDRRHELHDRERLGFARVHDRSRQVQVHIAGAVEVQHNAGCAKYNTMDQESDEQQATIVSTSSSETGSPEVAQLWSKAAEQSELLRQLSERDAGLQTETEHLRKSMLSLQQDHIRVRNIVELQMQMPTVPVPIMGPPPDFSLRPQHVAPEYHRQTPPGDHPQALFEVQVHQHKPEYDVMAPPFLNRRFMDTIEQQANP